MKTLNNNFFKNSLAVILCSLSLPLISQAQTRQATDTIIPNQTIEIIQNYKPEIAQPVKPEYAPTLNITDTSKPELDYDVPQQKLSYTYHSIPIRPLALGRIEQKKPFENYIKLGFGNLNSILADGGYAYSKTDLFQTAIHVHHLSQKASLENQRTSTTSADLNGSYQLRNHEIHGGIDFLKRNIDYYGYNHDSVSFSHSSVRQSFFGLGVHAGLNNTKANNIPLYYQPLISFRYYSDHYDASETSFGIALPFQYHIKDSILIAKLSIKGNYTQFKNATLSQSNNMTAINPALEFKKGIIAIHVGVKPTWSRDWGFSLLPDLSFKLHVPDSRFSLLAGWEGDIIQNTYEQLSTQNPFLFNNYSQQQTKFQRAFGGFESSIGQHLSFNASVAWQQWKGLPLFINNYTMSADGNYYTVVNDSSTQAIVIKADVRYQFAEKFSIGIDGKWSNFLRLENNDKAWMQPAIQLHGKLNWQMLNPLRFHADINFWDGLYALDAAGLTQKLPAFADLSLGAEYNIISRVSLFLQANNVLGTKYQRWYQYPVYGFNIIGGARLKF